MKVVTARDPPNAREYDRNDLRRGLARSEHDPDGQGHARKTGLVRTGEGAPEPRLSRCGLGRPAVTAQVQGPPRRPDPPQHTSQACSRCGHVDRDNRKTQSEFACVSCGYVRNADVNAAVNIWRRELAQLDGEKRSC